MQKEPQLEAQAYELHTLQRDAHKHDVQAAAVPSVIYPPSLSLFLLHRLFISYLFAL